MTRLVVAGVVVLALVAIADTLRPKSNRKADAQAANPVLAQATVHPKSSAGFISAGQVTHTRVLRFGREYLSADAIRAGFPVSLRGGSFDIAHLATGSDGVLVLAIYGFPEGLEAVDAIEIWRNRRLESSFTVPIGSFGGGVGFADEGRLVATLSGDGLVVHLFTPEGRYAGRQSATSW